MDLCNQSCLSVCIGHRLLQLSEFLTGFTKAVATMIQLSLIWRAVYGYPRDCWSVLNAIFTNCDCWSVLNAVFTKCDCWSVLNAVFTNCDCWSVLNAVFTKCDCWSVLNAVFTNCDCWSVLNAVFTKCDCWSVLNAVFTKYVNFCHVYILSFWLYTGTIFLQLLKPAEIKSEISTVLSFSGTFFSRRQTASIGRDWAVSLFSHFTSSACYLPPWSRARRYGSVPAWPIWQ